MMILDDVFEQKNEIANSVKEELEKVQGLKKNFLSEPPQELLFCTF